MPSYIKHWIIPAALLAAAAPGFPTADGADAPPKAPEAEVLDRAPVRWETDLATAFGLAQVSLKPVLVLFVAPRNIDCDRLKSGPLQNARIQELLPRFECVEIDAALRNELAMQYRVRLAPSFRVLEPDGRLRYGLDGYQSSSELATALEEFDTGLAAGPELAAMAERIKSGRIDAAGWANAMRMMSDAQGKAVIRQAVLMTATNARPALVGCLADTRLAVRSGALDLLEELAGDTMGFDPFLEADAPGSAAALARWRNWMNATNSETVIYSILTDEEFTRGLQDLIGHDPGRSSRALRLLGQGGETVARGIVAYLEAHPDLEEGSRRRIKEVQYSVAIPPESRLNPAATAHRLIWGNQDVQLQTIRQLADCGLRGMPILADLLKSPDPLVREAAVESAFTASGRFAVKPLQAHLKEEQDPDVIYAILRQFGKTATRRSLITLESFFTHENEELAVAAIEGASKNKLGVDQSKILPLLKDPRWRVRVAALQGLKVSKDGDDDTRGRAEAVKGLINDPDPFVRHTAVTVLVKMGMGGAADDLKALYKKYPDMRGLVVGSLLALGKPVPPEFLDELIDRDPVSLLQALDGMDRLDDASRGFLHRAAASAQADVSCAALGVLARSENRSAADTAVLVQALRQGKPEQMLTVIQEYDVDYRQREELKNRLKKGRKDKPKADADGAKAEAFLVSLASRASKASGISAGTAREEDLLEEVRRVMDDPAASDSIRRYAMLLLCRFGHGDAIRKAEREWDALTIEDQAAVAAQLDSFGEAAVPLFRKAVYSKAEEVWQAALEQLSDSDSREFVPLFMDRLLASSNAPKVSVIWPFGVNSMCGKFPDLLLPRLRPVLAAGWEKNDLLIMSLAVVAGAGKSADLPLVLPYTTHADPFVRRAGWMAAVSCGGESLTGRVEAIRKDPSWYVRDVLPGWFTAKQNMDRLEIYFSADEAYERYDGLELERKYSVRDTPMSAALTEAFQKMADEDPDPWIRFRCYLLLLGNGVPEDLNRVYEVARQCPKKKSVAAAVSSFLSRNDSKLGRSFARLLPLLKADGDDDDEPYVVPRLKKRWGVEEAEGDDVELSFVYAARPSPGANRPLVASVNGRDIPAAPRPTSRGEPVLMVYFTTPGCQSCASFERAFEDMKAQYPKLTVQTHSIRTAEGLQLNEVLCQQFNVPSRNRGITPAVFAARGNLIKMDLTRKALWGLLEQSYQDPGANSWLKVTDEDKKTAQAAIDGRWRSFTVPLVMGGGLADGVNPCAFATILFLISYLRVRRRSPREIVWIGLVYVLAVFATYFAVGVGLTSLVDRLGTLGWLRSWVNGLLAAALLVVAALSVRDGILCLRGRGADMTLQLPESMKKGIHQVVRQSTASPRYILAAALLGVAVSLLELACTGQVYLPTIVYMAQISTQRAQALLLLGMYNLAFVAPLVVVFVLASAGVGSERLQGFMVRHMAPVKFAMALLFVLLFVVLLRFG